MRSVQAELDTDPVVLRVGSADGADTSVELYAARERKELLELVLHRQVELAPA